MGRKKPSTQVFPRNSEEYVYIIYLNYWPQNQHQHSGKVPRPLSALPPWLPSAGITSYRGRADGAMLRKIAIGKLPSLEKYWKASSWLMFGKAYDFSEGSARDQGGPPAGFEMTQMT